MQRLLSLTYGRWRLWPLAVFLCVWITAMFCLMLPYDSVLRQSIRFNAMRAFNSLASPPWSPEMWMPSDAAATTNTDNPPVVAMSDNVRLAQHHSQYHVRPYDNIGLIIKSGYGTRHRVPAQINALGLQPHAEDAGNVVVIGDFTGQIRYNITDNQNITLNKFTNSTATATVAVHNVIAAVLESRAVGPRIRCPRAIKYRGLSAAIHRGNDAEAVSISRDYGWELDAMKFIPGLELAFDVMPNKDWYVMIDDDTFLVPPSLHGFLARLDPATPLYIGNAVGDFRLRFAHGGSAVVLSRAAVALLLDDRAAVHQSYVESLTATLGDRLLASTLMHVGIYLDERFSHLFNGARPHDTRISADRFCLPLISLHGLTDDARMVDTGRHFDQVNAGGNSNNSSNNNIPSPPFAWGDLWPLYGRPTVAALRRQPMRSEHDFVGRPGDDSSAANLVSTTVADVPSAEMCRAICERGLDDKEPKGPQSSTQQIQGQSPPHNSPVNVDGTCLAWTWDGQALTCTTSPWFVIGVDSRDEDGHTPVPSTTFSGVPAARLQTLIDRCSRRSGVAWAATDSGYYALVRSDANDRSA
ncbi:hypothetical protein CMQ_4749 [Grosmannia clavigera kw1407]|uniref:N-acetylgalactosaminide beta-1,3-galactosyltransferase n=1 Tax=Grosmannia clavigera (strain kw1407 / UAMH 11150) TaxID=655863 RepID=F0XUZ5_GROCL|nr:uncharacterized protein CMQ_4749 [Grosmannia clavigera kw1407]EFW98897.1 hypothetical protein CMQ_4749 [Grosmannia clavigera kw1407]